MRPNQHGRRTHSKILVGIIGAAVVAVVLIQVSLVYPFLTHRHDTSETGCVTVPPHVAAPADGSLPRSLGPAGGSSESSVASSSSLPPVSLSLLVPPDQPPTVPELRKDRFPSVEERVRIYMSDWYIPPCPDAHVRKVHYKRFLLDGPAPGENTKNDAGRNKPKPAKTSVVAFRNEWMSAFQLKSEVQLERVFAAYPQDFLFCRNTNAFPMYCGDVVDGMLTRLQNIQRDARNYSNSNSNSDQDVPILMHIGDLRYAKNAAGTYFNIPHFKKFRMAIPAHELQVQTTAAICHSEPRPIRANRELEPIVWKLNINRHYGTLKEVYPKDIPWQQKIPKAIFRGKYTGPTVPGFQDEATVCFGMPRCHLVYKYINSTIVDARLTDKIQPTMGGVPVLGPKMGVADLLKYKAIIMVEGNDVATGLKWALLSNSVVLMVPPNKMTYAMEDQLIPWVHYVPLAYDFSDVEQKTQWVIDNDRYAQQIAIRATLWIQDLVEHEDAMSDHIAIETEILKRYRMHFQQDDSMTLQRRTK